LSLDDILEKELPLLNDLVRSKEKLLKEQEKKRIEREILKKG